MSTKKSKRLRREIKYHPNMEREYTRVKHHVLGEGGKRYISYQTVLAKEDPHKIYQESKVAV